MPTPARMSVTRIAAALCAVAVSFAAACSGSSTEDTSTVTAGTSPAATTTILRPTDTADELVTIDAGRLHVRFSGDGDATVLLIAGWDDDSETWAAVEPSVADRARVCVYDRFGTGSSDAPTTPQTFETQATDLHELLDRTGEPGPYVLVGHSFGGAEAVTFASMYPEEVAGLVLVDASPTTWPDAVCSIPAYAGGCALMEEPSQGERLDVFPAFEAVGSISSLGDVPMTVMTAAHRSPDGLTAEERTRLDTLWREGTEDWATLSTASRIVTVEDVGHVIQAERPSIVIDEIVALVP